MPKKGINIYQRKDGRWEGRYHKERNADGKLVYGYLYGKTNREVRRQMEILEANDHFFADVAFEWLTMMSAKLKPSTCACYASALETHILPVLGDRRIRLLSGGDINSYTREKLDTGRKDSQGGLSVKTVRDLLFIIKSIRDYAYEEHIIPNKFEIVYPTLQKNEMRVLTKQEQSALVKVLTKDTDIFQLGILLCLYTGLRVGEICALRWQDLSANYDVLTVRQTLQRIKNPRQDRKEDGKKTKILIGTPKSCKSERMIPIPRFLVPFLRAFAERGNEYLISMEGMGYTEPRTMQNHFTRNSRKAGVLDANFHSLRHSFATRCVEAGVDVKSLSEMLGHANTNITLDLYIHSSLEQKKSCMERLEQYTGLV